MGEQTSVFWRMLKRWENLAGRTILLRRCWLVKQNTRLWAAWLQSGRSTGGDPAWNCRRTRYAQKRSPYPGYPVCIRYRDAQAPGHLAQCGLLFRVDSIQSRYTEGPVCPLVCMQAGNWLERAHPGAMAGQPAAASQGEICGIALPPRAKPRNKEGRDVWPLARTAAMAHTDTHPPTSIRAT